MIQAEDVRKTYTQDGVETDALRGVTLSIGDGEHVAITGPSDSGKSTLLAHLTVLENVLSPFLGRRRERASHREAAGELLEAVGLQDVANRPAGVLSGGEKQRVAIARALVNSPAILLCDEPTGNLDSKNSEAVMDLITALAAADERKILVVVTHDPKVASRFEREIRMRDGQVLTA